MNDAEFKIRLNGLVEKYEFLLAQQKKETKEKVQKFDLYLKSQDHTKVGKWLQKHFREIFADEIGGKDVEV